MTTTRQLGLLNVKVSLVIAAMAFTILFATDSLAAAKNDIVGSWSSSGFAQNGAYFTAKYEFKAIGSGSFYLYANNRLLKADAFGWELDGERLCLGIIDGEPMCLHVDFVNRSSLSLSSPGGRTVYVREGL